MHLVLVSAAADPEIVVPVFGSTTAVVLWFAVTVLMPLAVGLTTKWNTSSAVKSLLLVGLSLANGFASEWLAAGDTYNWSAALIKAALALVVAIASHFGVWIPTGATAVVQNVGSPVKYVKHTDGVYRPASARQ